MLSKLTPSGSYYPIRSNKHSKARRPIEGQANGSPATLTRPLSRSHLGMHLLRSKAVDAPLRLPRRPTDAHLLLARSDGFSRLLTPRRRRPAAAACGSICRRSLTPAFAAAPLRTPSTGHTAVCDKLKAVRARHVPSPLGSFLAVALSARYSCPQPLSGGARRHDQRFCSFPQITGTAVKLSRPSL